MQIVGRNVMQQEDKLVIVGTQAKIEKFDEFESSYFKDQYQQAFQAVQDIIDQNTIGSIEKSYIKKQNIIPFIGRRGSGKTSAMMSFTGYLSEYTEIKRKPYEFQKNGEKANVEFLCLESIDGSLLEEGEDIFKLILAQMYGEFFKNDKLRQRSGSWEKSYDYEKSELQQAFDRVYRSACELEKNGREIDDIGESSILNLKNLANSLQLAHDFERLVERYLVFLNYTKNENAYSMKSHEQNQSFLVITVDDLDLNLDQGYEMLEKLHRYTMVSNVIVMLSVDYSQIEILCEKQFYGMIPKFDSELQRRRNYVRKLSKDFLDKVFPGNYRIYMPMFHNTKDIQVIDSNGKSENPKTFLFKRLYQKLGLRLDIEGTKKHFYEQESLRTFVSFYLMLESMENITEKDETKQVFHHNYKVLMADTLNRMANERLDSDYMQLFAKLTENDFLHAARNLFTEIVRIAQGNTAQNGKNGADFQSQEQRMITSLGKGIAEVGYSYGEILRIIYCWGRINNESKAFVRCFLAYATLELTKEFYEFEVGNVKKKRYFADIMNGAVVGSWADKIMPKTFISSTPYSIGMLQNVDMESVFQFDLPAEMKVDCTKGYLIIENKNDPMYKKIKAYVKTMIVFSMFFEQPSYKVKESERWKFVRASKMKNEDKLDELDGLDELDEKEKSEKVNIISAEGYVNFNIFSFVSNAFLYEENVKPMVKSVCDILLGEDETNKKIKNGIIQEIDKEFNDWIAMSKGFALPIYDMDVTYNVVKRLRQRDRVKQSFNINDIWNEIVNIYEFIYDKLEKNDQEYASYSSHIDKIEYAKLYIECPYVKWILNDAKQRGGEKTRNLVPDIDGMFKKLVVNSLHNSTGIIIASEADANVNWGIDD